MRTDEAPLKRLVGSSLAGLSATLLMEQVANFLYERERPEAREREDAARSEAMPTTALAKRVAERLGRSLDDGTADRVGMGLHYGFGAAGGPLTLALCRAGMEPVRAGLSTGLGMFVFVDEGLNTAAGLTAPPQAFPLLTHGRALVAHVVYGAAVGLLLAAGGDR